MNRRSNRSLASRSPIAPPRSTRRSTTSARQGSATTPPPAAPSSTSYRTVRVDVVGLERLVSGRTYVFVANHQSIYDIPILFWSIPRQRGDLAAIRRAAAAIKSSKRPLIIAGGGVIYSEATEALRRFAALLIDGARVSSERRAGPSASR